MNTWQFSFYIVPKENITGISPLRDEYYSLASKKMSKSDLDFLMDTLKTCDNKYDDAYYYGSEESNCVVALTEQEVVASLYARFDLYNSSESFMKAVIGFAKEKDMVFIGDYDVVFMPHFHALKTEIRKADEFRFIRDPEAFFESIGMGPEV